MLGVGVGDKLGKLINAAGGDNTCVVEPIPSWPLPFKPQHMTES